MSMDNSITNILAALEGDEFCQDPNQGLDSEQIQTCQKYLKEFLPDSIKGLMQMLKDRREEACNLYFDAIC